MRRTHEYEKSQFPSLLALVLPLQLAGSHLPHTLFLQAAASTSSSFYPLPVFAHYGNLKYHPKPTSYFSLISLHRLMLWVRFWLEGCEHPSDCFLLGFYCCFGQFIIFLLTWSWSFSCIIKTLNESYGWLHGIGLAIHVWSSLWLYYEYPPVWEFLYLFRVEELTQQSEHQVLVIFHPWLFLVDQYFHIFSLYFWYFFYLIIYYIPLKLLFWEKLHKVKKGLKR